MSNLLKQALKGTASRMKAELTPLVSEILESQNLTALGAKSALTPMKSTLIKWPKKILDQQTAYAKGLMRGGA